MVLKVTLEGNVGCNPTEKMIEAMKQDVRQKLGLKPEDIVVIKFSSNKPDKPAGFQSTCYHWWDPFDGVCWKCGNIAQDEQARLMHNPETLERRYDEFLGRETFFKKAEFMAPYHKLRDSVKFRGTIKLDALAVDCTKCLNRADASQEFVDSLKAETCFGKCKVRHMYLWKRFRRCRMFNKLPVQDNIHTTFFG